MTSPGDVMRIVAQPEPANVERGKAFARRQDWWREVSARHHARHADVEPRVGEVLAALFDAGVRVFGPVREYAYRIAETGQTVMLNAETWHWYVLDGTAEGRGLYELWAWRFDVGVEDAHSGIWAMLNSAAPDEAASDDTAAGAA